ncbi:hypothetical protein ZWY2020_021976, partial [Hordeum vulgare]
GTFLKYQIIERRKKRKPKTKRENGNKNSNLEKSRQQIMRFTNAASGMASVNTATTMQPFEIRISPKENSGFNLATACVWLRRRGAYLPLTGPSLAVVLLDPTYFEIDLKVKGIGQSEDQDLIFVAHSFSNPQPNESALFKRAFKGKIGTVELIFCQIVKSVEAAVSMEVVHGSWPDGFQGCFAAKIASINDMTVVLLETGDKNELPLADDGTIKLQRHVVSEFTLYFTPQGTLHVGTCEIEVTVTWSLIMSF